MAEENSKPDVGNENDKASKKRPSDGDAKDAGMSTMSLEEVQKNLLQMQVRAGPTAPKSLDDAKSKEYAFWSTQPVPKFNEQITDNGCIEENKPQHEIRKEPYSLPAGFVWDKIDLNNTEQLEELYTLLNENYVEDDDNMFRFDYSTNFLQWALQPPGWLGQWHIGVRVEKNKKLIGFISAIPANMQIRDKECKLVEINFLCVHKKLRSKRVAPVLIREITRRVNFEGIFQAVYTGGVVLPKPVATCRYWHRSLNPRKLIECKFSQLSKNMTMQRTVKLYKLPDQTQIPGFRILEVADIPAAHKLLDEYLSKFLLYPKFTVDEFKHWFLTREGIVNSFVVEKDSKITDFCSFYTLPSSVIQHPVHKQLKAAYSFYNVAAHTPWTALMRDALIVAKNLDFDVFNALDLMNNTEFLEELKFGVGDGHLHYYLYNWRCPNVEAPEVGLVLQ